MIINCYLCESLSHMLYLIYIFLAYNIFTFKIDHTRKQATSLFSIFSFMHTEVMVSRLLLLSLLIVSAVVDIEGIYDAYNWGYDVLMYWCIDIYVGTSKYWPDDGQQGCPVRRRGNELKIGAFLRNIYKKKKKERKKEKRKLWGERYISAFIFPRSVISLWFTNLALCLTLIPDSRFPNIEYHGCKELSSPLASDDFLLYYFSSFTRNVNLQWDQCWSSGDSHGRLQHIEGLLFLPKKWMVWLV